MPYKDPERKRQWEQEHRQQRNARRRIQRAGEMPDPVSSTKPLTARRSLEDVVRLRKKFAALRTTDPTPTQKQGSGWEGVIAVALGIGAMLLGFWGLGGGPGWRS